MRSLSVLLCIVAIVALPAQAAPPLRPPVIRESFTLLPCPAHPGTTIAHEGCGEKAISRSDRAINARVRKIFGVLRSHAARASFVRGERAWLRYRRASCAAEASVYAGGSAEPLLFLDCELHRNRTHLADLGDLGRTLGPH